MKRTFTKYPNNKLTAFETRHEYTSAFGALLAEEVIQIEDNVAKMSDEDLLRAYTKHWFKFASPGTSTREDDIAEIYKAEILSRMG